MNNPSLSVAALTALAIATLPTKGALEVTPDHIVSGTATGTLVAVDVPFLGAANIANSTFPVGPDFPDNADDGFRGLKPNGSIFWEYLSGTSNWEPDGTPLSEAKTYRTAAGTQGISNPDVSWTFDLPDGAVINAVYATWTTAGTGQRTNWGYTEGAATGLYTHPGALPTGDLVLRWFDSAAGSHDGNFQRILSGPITVEGGDGFTLKAYESWNVGPIDAVVIDFTPSTIGPPTLVSTSPADNAANVPPGSDLVARFSEDIVLTGNGSITVRHLNGGSDRVIDLTGPDPDGGASVSGAYLTIELTASLDVLTNYAVRISTDAIEDLDASPNAFVGIADDTTWNFTTSPPDTFAPVVTALSPLDDGRGVSPWTNLVATFDEPVTLKDGGTITITDLSDGSSSQVITLPDARVSSPNGDDLSIDLATELDLVTHYSVRISAAAVEDQADAPNLFPGILDDTTWNFTTLTQVQNVLIVTAELSDAQPSATAAEMEETVFSGAVNVDDAMRVASYNQMGLRLGDGTAMDPTVELYFPELVAATANSEGNSLRGTMTSELLSMGYDFSNYRFILYVFPNTVVGAAGAASNGGQWSTYKVPTIRTIVHELGHCLGGNHSGQDPGCALGWAGVNYSAEKKIRFGWLDAFPGTVSDVASDTTLTLVPLSEDPTTLPGMRVVRVVRPDGLVYHISYRVSKDPYSRLSDPAAYSQEVFVSLDLGGTLTSHRATLAAGEVFTDGIVTVTCDSVAGDGQSAEVTIGVIDPAPTVAFLLPADNDGAVPLSTNIVATFSENVSAGTSGMITLKRESDDSVVESFDVTNPTEVSFSGAQVTVEPTSDLAPGVVYYVEIDDTAIVDSGSNPFAGIADATTWNFTGTNLPFETIAYWQFDSNSGAAGLSDAVGSYDLSVVAGTFVADAAAAVTPVPNPDQDPNFAGDASANPDPALANASLLAPGGTARHYLSVPSDPGNVFNLAGKSFTFEGWFQHDTGSTPAGFGDMIGGTRNAGSFQGYVLRMAGGGEISAYITDGTNAWGPSTSGTNYNDGTFHHFAFVWQDGAGDNSTGLASLYIDGVPEASVSAPAAFDAATADAGAQAFIIGGRAAASDNTWDGRFDEFRFVSSALAPSDFLYGSAPPTNTFSTWISSAAFGLAQGDQGFTNDPDGDGLGNGVEAYFGTNPSSFDSGITGTSKSGNIVTFQHPNPTTPLDGVTGSYQWSRDLQTWHAADGVETDGSTTANAVATPDSPSTNTTTVVATIGGTVPGKIFLRAVATMP